MHNMKNYLDILFKLSVQPQAKHERRKKIGFTLSIPLLEIPFADNEPSGGGLR